MVSVAAGPSRQCIRKHRALIDYGSTVRAAGCGGGIWPYGWAPCGRVHLHSIDRRVARGGRQAPPGSGFWSAFGAAGGMA